jgi:hypothetical protein
MPVDQEPLPYDASRGIARMAAPGLDSVPQRLLAGHLCFGAADCRLWRADLRVNATQNRYASPE